MNVKSDDIRNLLSLVFNNKLFLLPYQLISFIENDVQELPLCYSDTSNNILYLFSLSMNTYSPTFKYAGRYYSESNYLIMREDSLYPKDNIEQLKEVGIYLDSTNFSESDIKHMYANMNIMQVHVLTLNTSQKVKSWLTI